MAGNEQRPVCMTCGTIAPRSEPIGWSRQADVRGPQWLCERCTRDNLRSIEGRLDQEWW